MLSPIRMTILLRSELPVHRRIAQRLSATQVVILIPSAQRRAASYSDSSIGEATSQSSIERQKAPLLLGGAHGRSRLRTVKFFLGAGADLLQFRMKPPDFGVQFDEIQTLGSEQFVSRYTRVIVAGTRFHVYAGGRLFG